MFIYSLIGTFTSYTSSEFSNTNITASINTVNDEVLLSRLSSIQNENESIKQIRKFIISNTLNHYLTEFRSNFSGRSAIFRSWHEDIQSNGEVNNSYIYRIGLFFMTIGLFCTAIFIPVFTLFVIYGCLFPIIQFIK